MVPGVRMVAPDGGPVESWCAVTRVPDVRDGSRAVRAVGGTYAAALDALACVLAADVDTLEVVHDDYTHPQHDVMGNMCPMCEADVFAGIVREYLAGDDRDGARMFADAYRMEVSA